MKLFYVLIFSLLLFIAVIVTNNSNDTKRINYASLSKGEINKFVEERNIEPLATENTQNESIILVDGGTYSLSKRSDNGEVVKRSTRWDGSQKEVQLGFRSTGSPYIYLILEDETLIEQAYKVEVMFNDGTSVSKLVEDSRGFILFYDKKAKNLNIEDFELNVYDEDENTLYETKG
ncbi:hypothetical protein [Halobacillus amylolyticus]|uniref:Uncharacterized protein n=1 Tax=Halobacillus amylolyticus TaxID=2932259 RepID=A0ABY4HEI8_9BACI|nr:hypothetical protein [Halobacillus amylolyticus]UOR12822.1 hypothetical protein MUO15_04720 [Halobacillus amylolyticus]